MWLKIDTNYKNTVFEYRLLYLHDFKASLHKENMNSTIGFLEKYEKNGNFSAYILKNEKDFRTALKLMIYNYKLDVIDVKNQDLNELMSILNKQITAN